MSCPNESIEQITFVNWFRENYPDVLIFAIPNGGLRHKAVAEKLKAEGVMAGVPDLFIPEWRLWIEMKREKGGVTSDIQKAVMLQLELAGYKCRVCRGHREAIETCTRMISAGR